MKITRGDYEITLGVLEEIDKRIQKSKRIFKDADIANLRIVQGIIYEYRFKDSKNWIKR